MPDRLVALLSAWRTPLVILICGCLIGLVSFGPRSSFGFFLTPFRYGAPPHGGFAFGIDRLAAILAGEENIREVIAFPKPQSGIDPMTQAPTPVEATQLADLGLRTLPPKT